MDPITQQQALASAGAGGDSEHVDDVFSTYTYTGTGSDITISNGIDLDGEGGLVWFKSRTSGSVGTLIDTERGKTRQIIPSTAGGQNNGSFISSFNSDGFTATNNASTGENGEKYVSWTFRKAPGFFDVVTWSGDNTTNRQIPHNLKSVPGLILIKSLQGYNWTVYHRSTGASKYGSLNENDHFSSTSGSTDFFNNTAPTSTHFTICGDSSAKLLVNDFGSNYVAYLFAHDDQKFGPNGNEAIVKCGTYNGQGSDQVINIGFEPQFMMVKCHNTGGNGYGWTMIDASRHTILSADTNSTQFGSQRHTFLNNGVRWDSGDSDINESGKSYIYIAIRRPTKPITDRTKLYNAISRTGTDADAEVTNVGFPPDLVITKNVNVNGYQIPVRDRIRGYKSLVLTHDNRGENLNTTQGLTEFTQNGFNVGADESGSYSNTTNNNGQTYLNWCFRRSTGFFDIVEYQGTGSAQNINHDLDVKPELIITKNIDSSAAWAVYADALGATKRLRLNYTGGPSSISSYWNDTEPTSSVFTVGNDTNTGANSKYIAYLFASVENVCKIGTYTGDGGNNNYVFFGTGYTAQPRFLLVKSADVNTSGDWVLVDSVRGMAGGYDPYLKLNTDDPQVTGQNVVQAFSAGSGNSSGFTPFGILNNNNETYLYLAIL